MWPPWHTLDQHDGLSPGPGLMPRSQHLTRSLIRAFEREAEPLVEEPMGRLGDRSMGQGCEAGAKRCLAESFRISSRRLPAAVLRDVVQKSSDRSSRLHRSAQDAAA